MANPATATQASQLVLEKTFFTGMGDFADSAKLLSYSRVVFYVIFEPFSDMPCGLKMLRGLKKGSLSSGLAYIST